MIKALRDFIAGKIQINVNYIVDGIKPSTVPKITSKIVNRFLASNYRFCQYETKNTGEKDTRIYYYTELFDGSKWNRVDDSWYADKDKAMDIHLKLVNGEQLSDINVSKRIETVLWEGLSKEETNTWVNLQRGNAT